MAHIIPQETTQRKILPSPALNPCRYLCCAYFGSELIEYSFTSGFYLGRVVNVVIYRDKILQSMLICSFVLKYICQPQEYTRGPCDFKTRHERRESRTKQEICRY